MKNGLGEIVGAAGGDGNALGKIGTAYEDLSL
jgi:hypothetical protein